MNHLKHISLSILLCAILFSVSGCTKNREEQSESIQYINNMESLTDTIMFHTSNGLQRTNLEQGQSIFVCNQSSCVHSTEDCFAIKYQLSNYPLEYGEKLFFIRKFYNDTEFVTCEKDGSNMEILNKWDGAYEMGNNAVRVGENLYYFAKKNQVGMTEAGYVYVKNSKAALYETNIRTGKTKNLYEIEDSYGTECSNLLYSNGKLFCLYVRQNKSIEDAGYSPEEYFEALNDNEFIMRMEELFDIRTNLVVVDLEKEQSFVSKDEMIYQLNGVWNGEAIITYKNKRDFYNYDYENNTNSVWHENDGSMIMTQLSEGILLSYFDMQTFEKTNYLYTGDWDALKKLQNNKNLNMSVILEAKDTIYVSWEPRSMSSSEEQWEYSVERKEFLFGK